MTSRSKWRGHAIEHPGWVYSDTGEPVANGKRACGHCHKPPTADDHDACLGTLPGVMNACCGHGVSEDAYVQMNDRSTLRGEPAKEFIRRLLDERE
jgi:hypothetical protein